MAAFNTGMIPASITTMEGLAVWVGSVMNFTNPNSIVIETETRAEKACQFGTFQDANGNDRVLIRLCVEINSNWASNGLKYWQNAKEFPLGAAVPASYTT